MYIPYLNVNIDVRTKRNPRYAKFLRRLAKVAQTAPIKHTLGNDAIVAMKSHNDASLQRANGATRREFCLKQLLHFCKFLVNQTSTLNLTISSEANNRRFK